VLSLSNKIELTAKFSEGKVAPPVIKKEKTDLNAYNMFVVIQVQRYEIISRLANVKMK
jgi:hypothetical protein